MTTAVRIEDLLRELAPQVLGALVRRHGQFDACEDAVQEALLGPVPGEGAASDDASSVPGPAPEPAEPTILA